MEHPSCLFAKESSVSIEEVSAEPKQDEARLGHLDRHRFFEGPIACGIAHHHACERAIAMADVLEQRQNRREEDALLHPESNNGESCEDSEGEFARRTPPNLSEATKVNEFDANQKDNGSQDSIGKVAQRPRQ